VRLVRGGRGGGRPWRVMRLPTMVAVASALGPGVPAQAQPAPAPGEAITGHVLVITIDGLRPDAIDRFGLRTLQRLLRDGSGSLSAATVIPSTTLPAHTSMMTGVPPEVHGVTWNRHVPARGVVGVPTILELARARGHTVAAFWSKAKLRHLDRPGADHHRMAPLWNSHRLLAADVVPLAIRHMRRHRPNLMVVHIADPDLAGHLTGWMSSYYGLAARQADAGVAALLSAADAVYGPGGFTVIVTTDHGGHGRGHAGGEPADTRIPWIIYGAGVRGGPAPAGVRITDTAPTVLRLLGIPIPPHMAARPVLEVLRAAPPAPRAGLTSGRGCRGRRCG
jgi:arylsulfatase A-like enzyme